LNLRSRIDPCVLDGQQGYFRVHFMRVASSRRQALLISSCCDQPIPSTSYLISGNWPVMEPNRQRRPTRVLHVRHRRLPSFVVVTSLTSAVKDRFKVIQEVTDFFRHYFGDCDHQRTGVMTFSEIFKSL